MSQSLAQVYLHLVFSTKNREAWLEKSIRSDLHAYFGGICNGMDVPCLKVGGVADHVHILARFPRTLTIAKWVEELKTGGNKWFKSHGTQNNRGQFAWQSGYGVFSVSPSHMEALLEYIENQEEHHRSVTFQEEYRRMLEKYRISYDERYVWD